MKIKRAKQRDAQLACSDKRKRLSLCRPQSPLPSTIQARAQPRSYRRAAHGRETSKPVGTM